MTKEQAVVYLRFSGFSEEQIKAIEGAFACEDAISRQAVLDKLNRLIEVERLQGTDEMGYGRERVRAYESMIFEIESEYLYPSVNPQKPICPSAGVDCEDCPAYEDAIGRKAVLNTLENMDRALDEDRTVESYKELLRECYKILPSVTPKPKSECEHDHEILKAYSDGASAVLESIKYLIEQYEHYLELLDADMKDGSATIVTKTKYAVYTEVVKQLKEVLESEDKA